MPLPLILAGAAVLAAGYGVKKGVDAKSDYDTAERWHQKAQDVFDTAKDKLEKDREGAQKAMNALGATKFHLYEESLIPFKNAFSVIKNVDFEDMRSIDDWGLSVATRESLGEMTKSILQVEEVMTGSITALGSGGVAGLAAYGSVGMLGTASTGTAIGSLSGVAATNATLAWLGGGSLAAGGFGMAGGAVVLGGIVAGPVLAVGGMMLASKAEEAKFDAYSKFDEAELAAEEMKSAAVATRGIKRRFKELDRVLCSLNEVFIPLLGELEILVSTKNNYKVYTQIEKENVRRAVATATTLKNLVDTPVLDKDGTLTKQSRKMVLDGNKVIKQIGSLDPLASA